MQSNYLPDDTEQWCKIWINPDLGVPKIAWRIEWTFIQTTQKCEKMYIDRLFRQKRIMF